MGAMREKSGSEEVACEVFTGLSGVIETAPAGSAARGWRLQRGKERQGGGGVCVVAALVASAPALTWICDCR